MTGTPAGPPAEVLVVGQIARDLVLLIDDVPGPHRTAAVRARRELLGGKGANQAVALAQLGVAVGLLGVVGDDRVGAELLAQARADRVGVAEAVRRDGVRTALIVDVVDRQAHWRYLEDIPEPTLLTEDDVDSAAGALRAAATVSVQLQQPVPAAMAAIRHAKAAGRRVVVDGAPADEAYRDAILGAADVVRADAQEAALLAGHPVEDVTSALRVGRELLRRGPALVALAVGGAGNVFVWPGDSLFLPLVDTEVVDRTGAGDAFVAGLTTGLIRGEKPHQAARMAVAAAAATVGHPGGRPELGTATLRRQLAMVEGS
jgi:ribokinase